MSPEESFTGAVIEILAATSDKADRQITAADALEELLYTLTAHYSPLIPDELREYLV